MTVSMRNRAAIAILLLVAAAAPFAGLLARGEVPSFRDHESYFLPLRWHTAEALRAGEIPLWNPWNGGGEPWLANPQTGVFYPPAWLMVVLPFSQAYSFFLIFHLAILGWGSWTLFRRWAADGPALTAAIGLMLSGPVFSLLDINNNLASFAWLPLVIRFAAERKERRTTGSLLALIGGLALAFLGGEPLYAAIAALVTLAILLPRDWRGALLVGGGAAALTSIQLLPFLAWVSGSERAAGLDPAEAFQHAVGAGDWLALAIPMVSASGTMEPLRLGQRFLPSFYIGVPLVILALSAGLGSLRTEKPERRRILAWLLLSFVAVVLLASASRWPAGRELLVAVNANAFRYPARLVPLGALLVTGLAAIGLDRVRREPLSTRVGITLSIAVLVGLRFLTVEPMAEPTTALRFVFFLAWVAGFGLVFVAFPRWLVSRVGLVMLTLVLVADLLAASQPFLESRALVTRTEPWATALDHSGSVVRVPETRGSIARAPRAWLAGYLNLYGKHFDGSTPSPVVDRRAFLFQEAMIGGARPDLVDAAGVRWVLSSRESLGDRYARTGIGTGAVRLFENRSALPVVQLWSGAERARSHEEALMRVLSRDFDARRALVLSGVGRESGVAAERIPERVTRVPASLSFTHREARIEYDAPSDGVLVLNQRWSRGWSVRVNGRPAEPMVANGIFRAVEVPAGRGVVLWSYRPRALQIGAWISLTFVILLTGRFLFMRVSPFRK
ncbi:MAG: hypothetical protein ABR524_02610 [Thermoanaerobaculia bacterium]